MQSNADYANWFRGRPKRMVLPLDAPNFTKIETEELATLGCETPRIHYDLYNGWYPLNLMYRNSVFMNFLMYLLTIF